MGTKNKPGEFDCLDKVADDEPVFVLRAKDLAAPLVIQMWCLIRQAYYPQNAADEQEQRQLEEARSCTDDMVAWRRENVGAPHGE